MNFTESLQPGPDENLQQLATEVGKSAKIVIPQAATENSNIAHHNSNQEESEARQIAELREQLRGQIETPSESLEQKKERLGKLWSQWSGIKDNPELISLFNRKQEFSSEQEIDEILRENDYPERTKISELELKNWEANLNPKFIKDGFIYLLRGDQPNLDKKGFYTRTYGYGKLTTKKIGEQLHDSGEVGYILYNDERYLTTVEPSSDNIAEQLAYLQSARGGSSFISTTTSIPCAEAGTGNQPDASEQLQYEIYILKIPIDSAISSNTDNSFGLEEDEVLVPDYIAKDEIIAKFPRNNTEEVYQYLHNLLGISREDIRM